MRLDEVQTFLRVERERLGLSRPQLCAHLNLKHRSSVGLWETAEPRWKMSTLQAWAGAFGYGLAWEGLDVEYDAELSSIAALATPLDARAAQRMLLVAELAAARRQAGMTQAELGDMLGLGDTTISWWERECGDPVLPVAEDYARCLDLRLSWSLVHRILW